MTRFVGDINAATPDGTDQLSGGDDEIRQLKSDIKNTFSKLNGEVSASETEINRLVGLTGVIITSSGGSISGSMAFTGPISINNDVSISGGVVIVGSTHFASGVTISATLVTMGHIAGNTAFFDGAVTMSATAVFLSAVKGVTPTADTHLATRAYVNTAVAAGPDPDAVDVGVFKNSRLKMFFHGQN